VRFVHDGVEGARRFGIISVIGGLVLVSTFASAVGSCGAYVAQRRANQASAAVQHETAERLHASCLDLNRNRADARMLVRDGDVASAEALIESVTITDESTAAIIARYRKNLARRSQQVLEKHKSEDVDCDEIAPLSD